MTAVALLTEAAREGFSLYVESDRVVVAGDGRVPDSLLRRLREAREEIRSLLEPSRTLRSHLAALAEEDRSEERADNASCSPETIARARGDPWARTEAAATIAKLRRWRDRRSAIAARDAWHERIAIATIDGGAEQCRAERIAADELVRFAEAWAIRHFSRQPHSRYRNLACGTETPRQEPAAGFRYRYQRDHP